MAGCAPQTTPPGDGERSELAALVEQAGEARAAADGASPTAAGEDGAEATARDATPAAAGEDGTALADEEEPASRDDVAALCRVYRKALRERWDDERTREQVLSLQLETAAARAWQETLGTGDADEALAASRLVVLAAEDLDLHRPCEPLASLVSLADAMRAAARSLDDREPR